MADAKYMDEHQADDSGLMLVDLLYGEVDDDDREHVLARVGEVELEGYGRLRAMMRELPEEEPPAALTAKLLHAAAMHAPQASAARADEARGVWAWLKSVFQPMLLHPGLAAAASLVLVVGVAGALYMTGRFEVAEPRHEAALQIQAGEQAAPAEAAEPGRLANEAAAAESTNAPAQDLDSESVAEAANAQAPAGMARREEQREPAAELSRERKADKASKSTSSRSAGYTLKSKDSDDFVELADDVSGRDKQGGSIGASGSAADSASGGVSGSTKKAAPPMRPSPAPAATGTARDTGLVQLDEAAAPEPPPPSASSPPADEGGAERQKTKAASSGTRIRSLHDEARDAARQGDCETVQQIGSSIRNQDAVYHRDVFRKDAQLSRCFGS